MALDLTIRTREDLIRVIDDFGFMPLFKNSVPGFSVEEHAAPEVWYKDGTDDWPVWSWKGPVIRESRCAYGKFFEKKAVFISREWFADFANYRRDGYDFDARWDDGLAFLGDKDLYELVAQNAPIASTALKRLGDYGKGGRKGFDTCMNRLQAQGYVLIGDFVYARNKNGKEYGWGIAEYTTPERFFGDGWREEAYRKTPAESYERIRRHLKKILPHAGDAAIRRMMR